MKPIEIRIELLRKGYSNAKVARDLRLSARTIHNVIYRHGRSRRVADHISKVTGVPTMRLFPEYGQVAK